MVLWEITSPTHLVPHKSMLLNFNGNGTLLHYVSGYIVARHIFLYKYATM